MPDQGQLPFRSPVQWFFRTSLLVLGAAIALNIAVGLFTDIWPWLVAVGALAVIAAIGSVMWRRWRNHW